MAADILEELVLLFEGGEGEESVEEDQDPVELLVEVELEGVLAEEFEVAGGKADGIALVGGDVEHVLDVVDAGDAVTVPTRSLK